MIISPPITNSIHRIADWIELHLMVANTAISKSKIISVLENNGVSIEEQDVDSVFSELERRQLLYGKVKPYQISGTNVSPNFNWKKMPEFVLCLYYSTYGVGRISKGGKRDIGTKLFEDITKSCLEKYLSSSSFAFGFPRRMSFKNQLDLFAKKINEIRNENPNPHDKDRDVDIILCKQFDESRNNCILFFVQCAAGKNWDEKKPVAIESYRRYFSFSNKTVISSIAITQVVDLEHWKNACDDYGIILDRARLYRIFSNKSYQIPKKLKSELIEWCNYRMNSVN